MGPVHLYALIPALFSAGLSLAAPKAPEAAAPPAIETRATDILKASSARLAAAKTMSFTAVVSYESPSRLGPPLVYSTKSEVALQRPNKLKIVTLGDGPASEFYYDGKVMMAFEPAANLVAIADAPPTIDAALVAADETAAIYYPFEDVIVADPYKDIAAGLTKAFYIGQSSVVDNMKTDMVAYTTGNVFVQAWIGVEDKLPHRLYATYLNDKAHLRHALALSDWKLDGMMADETFASAKAAAATRIEFARPDAKPANAAKAPAKAAAPKAAKSN